VKNKGNKLMTFRAFSIGFSTALLALACGSEDTNNGNGSPEPIPTPPVNVGDPPANPEPEVNGPGPVDEPIDEPEEPSSTGIRETAKAAAENVLRESCGACHGSQLSPGEASGNPPMNYIDDTDELVRQNKLIPLNPNTSPVIVRMRDGSMPPAGAAGRGPTQSDIDAVAQYIANPAFWDIEVDPNSLCEDQEFSFDDLYKAVADDLADADDDDGLDFRYISLTNRFTAGVCADERLDRDRQAMFKMMNALSINANVEAPTPINPEETIYRIDLADYDWDRAIDVVDGGTTLQGGPFDDVWEAIIANNPYAVPFVGDDADDAVVDSGTTVPVMFADSMLDVATIGNLYYAIVGVDVTQPLQDFILNELEIDVDQNLIDGDQVRAGTTDSQISKQDRVLQRDEIENGAGGVLWQSFDFLADEVSDNIFEEPFDFLAGGTEAIFTLPNGMFAYIIADENDVIVEDSDILLDDKQGNNRAITSVSCSGCHASGFIPVDDEVREISLANQINFGFNSDEVDQLREVYVLPERFRQVIEEDGDDYRAALTEVGVPTNDGIDPVSFVFIQFDDDVTLRAAAGDLGVSPEFLDDNLNEVDPSLTVLERRTVDRDDFTAVYVDALCKLNPALDNVPDPVVCADAAALLE
jgi:mono/diheme cytochrome c family protein